jgi:PAS domain S-box-containing protein
MDKLKILYIEDDDQQRDEFSGLLESKDYSVSNAPNGPAGLTELERNDVDIILCDLHMPDMNGLEVLKNVKKTAPDVPFIMLTAHGSIDMAVDAIRQGANHFILKPLDIEDIVFHIHQAIEHCNLQKQLKRYSDNLEEMVEERTKSLEFVNRQLFALNELSNDLTKISNEDELLDKVPLFLTSTLDFDRGVCFMESNGELKLRSVCFAKDPQEMVDRFTTNLDSGKYSLPPHFEESLKENRTVLIRELNDDPRWPKEPGRVIRTKALVMTPIRLQNYPVGIIVGNMQHHERELDDQDIARFEMFANIVGMALDNIRNYKTLENKVDERTRSLRKAYQDLEHKADQLSQRKDQLQAILDSSMSATLMVNCDSKVTAINRQVRQFFNCTDDQIIDRSIDEFFERIAINFKDPDKYRTLVQRLREKPDSIVNKSFDMSIVHDRACELVADEARFLSVFSTPVLNEKDEEIGRVWVHADITSMKRAEEQVRLIVEASPIPTIITKIHDGEIVFANAQLGELIGIDKTELVGKTTPDFYYDPAQRDDVVDRLKKEGHLKNYEARLKRADGSTVWASLSLVVTQLSGETVVIGGITDFTQRKFAEEALKKERNFVSAILNTAGALVLVIDPQGRIIRFNRACEKTSGYSIKEVLGKNYEDLFIIPEEKELLRERVQEILKKRTLVQGENHWLTKDGDKRLIAWSNTVLMADDDSVEYIVATGIDITERKEAEEKLELYREIYLNSNDGITITDECGNYIESNPMHLRITGFDPKELRGIPIQDIMGGSFDQCMYDMVKRKHAFRGEFAVKRKDGTDVAVEVSAFSISDKSGKITNYAGIGRDMTQQKKAKDLLAKRVWYEEGLAACSQALLTISDQNEALNRALYHLLIASRSSRVYIFENFDDPDDGLCMRLSHEVCDAGIASRLDDPVLQHNPYTNGFTRWQNLLSQGEAIAGAVRDFPESERQLLEPQGIVSILALPFNVEGKSYGFIGFDDCEKERDDTDEEDIRLLRTASEMIATFIERRRFEEALRVSEERFRSLIENVDDIIFSLNPEGRFTYLSPQFTEVTGFEVVEFIGKPVTLLLHPDQAEESEQWIADGMPTKDEPSGGFQDRFKSRDGSWRWFTTHTSVIRDENDDVIEVIGITHDITEMKNLLESLESANQELRETQSQLVQSAKMASLGQLVAGIAHEINTPIGAVNSMHDSLVRAMDKLTKTLEDRFPDEFNNSKDVKQYIKVIGDANNVIESGTERVTTIVRRLRSFARLDEADLKTVDIHDGLEDTLTLIHHEIKHHITIKRDYGKIPPFACYPGRLNQVFLNLLNNARQAIKGKGEIAIKTWHKNEKAYIQISDNGMGIAGNDLKKIFDPGFTTKGVGVGTGLGLSICFQIINDHQGDIKVDSVIGQGTTFTIILPMDLDKRAANNKK